MKAYLEVISEPHRGQRIALKKSRIVIGRDSRCQIRPNGGGVSRLHCALEQDGNDFYLTDLGSTNGTILNGQPMHDRVRLRHGDEIAIGQLVVRFMFDPPPRPAAPPTPEDEALEFLSDDPTAPTPQVEPAQQVGLETTIDLDGARPDAETREVDAHPLPPDPDARPAERPPAAAPRPKQSAASSDAASDILRRIKDGTFFKPK